jgi:hypothetical protein
MMCIPFSKGNNLSDMGICLTHWEAGSLLKLDQSNVNSDKE